MIIDNNIDITHNNIYFDILSAQNKKKNFCKILININNLYIYFFKFLNFGLFEQSGYHIFINLNCFIFDNTTQTCIYLFFHFCFLTLAI